MLSCRQLLVLLATAVCLSASSASATRYYVDRNATGLNTGLSWTDAFVDLQDALAAVSSGDEVWVAKGKYVPTTTTDQTISFVLVDGVEMYGGFAGGETMLSERDFVTNRCRLSGEINGGSILDNTYHVVRGDGVSASAVLDGFVIKDGWAAVFPENDGGGIHIVGGSPTINNCTIRLNGAAGDGGGAYLENSSSVFTNVIFEDNNSDNGGAAYITLGSVTFDSCFVDSNEALQWGGGVYVNNNTSATFINTTFNENVTGFGGGALRGGNPTITGCTFTLNEGGSEGGGAIYFTNAQSTITSTYFSDNTVPINDVGGAVRMSGGNVSFLKATFERNSARHGGAVHIGSGTVNFDSTVVDSNHAELHGGGVWISNVGTTINNSSFTGNTSVNSGGAIRGYGDADNCVFTGNYSGGGGGAWLITGSTSQITNSQFVDNWSDGDGGATYGVAIMDACNFTGNTAERGGAAYQLGASPVSNCTFDDNEATIQGGAVNAWGSLAGNGFTDCVFTNNSAPAGGAMAIGNAPVNVTDCTFEDNSATTDGGAIVGALTTVVLRTSFKNNDAVKGGAVAITDGSFTNCDFDSNTANTGGAIWSDHLTSTNNDFVGNEAFVAGGAVALEPAVVTTISRGEMHGNHAPDGGAIHVDHQMALSTTIIDVDIHDNTATQGAGVFTTGLGTKLRIENVTIRNNHATANGGGLYGAGKVTLTSSLLTGNTAGTAGGAIANIIRPSFYTNLTLSENFAPTGGAIYNNDAWAEISNCILWGDSAASDAEIHNTGPNVCTVSHSVVEGSGGSGGGWSASMGNDGGGNWDVDPMFTNPGAGDFRPQAGSIAIQAGDNAANGISALDLDGNARIQGLIVDIGAYESASGVFCPGSRIYVDKNSPGPQTGVDWSHAYVELRDALTIADQCPEITEVWVAGGTYLASDQNDRSAHFVVRPGLSLYGGFQAVELTLEARDLSAATSILSAEIGAPGLTDNAYHVVTADSTDSTTVIDGFEIRGGYADGSEAGDKIGGGIRALDASPRLHNVTLADNYAIERGGGYHGTNGDVVMLNIVCINNASVLQAGGIYVANSTASITNGSFTANASFASGAFFGFQSSAVIHNTIMWGDSAVLFPELGMGVNAVVSHSIIEGAGDSGGGWNSTIASDGGGNVDADPQWVNAALQDLRLQTTSPAVNAGTEGVPLLTIDLDSNPRVLGTTVDIGAYELATTTAISDMDGDLPVISRLESAYPNPFNPTVRLTVAVAEAGPVDVTVFDVRGARVKRLEQSTRPAGRFAVTWDGRGESGESVASGVYFVRLTTRAATDVRKVTLLK